jgi:hypothetical protein
LGYIDDAYEAVSADYAAGTIDKATYDRLMNHIKLESIFPRQVMLTHFGAYYGTHLTALRNKFKEDCEALGVNYLSQHDPISKLWTTWGI